ncbi:hypothetical protein ACFLYF_03590 [Chloroflexota bacterium]
MVQEDQLGTVVGEQTLDIEKIKRRLDMLDQRLDNIDSMLTAIAERVTRQPLSVNVNCPRCGGGIEIALFGIDKPAA